MSEITRNPEEELQHRATNVSWSAFDLRANAKGQNITIWNVPEKMKSPLHRPPWKSGTSTKYWMQLNIIENLSWPLPKRVPQLKCIWMQVGWGARLPLPCLTGISYLPCSLSSALDPSYQRHLNIHFWCTLATLEMKRKPCSTSTL